MTTADIVTHRLVNQQLTQTNFQKPHEIVARLGAMQAQEYAMAKWAIGLRSPGLTDAEVEAAFNDGAMLRTHLLRPTWHFVAPADIRWILTLTAPRVHAFNARMYRKLDVNSAVVKRSNDALIDALNGGQHLTRDQLKDALERAGIVVDSGRLVYLLMRAELDGILCSGPRQGKQFTYALLDERVPPTRPLDGEEALAELTRRYFASRDPATLQDFVWWSGLTMKDTQAGVARLGPDFVRRTIDGQLYVFAPTELPDSSRKEPTAWLLPIYDEYGIGYRDRGAFFDLPVAPAKEHGKTMPFDRSLIVDGVVAGNWKPTSTTKTINVQTVLFAPLDRAKQKAVENAVQRYVSFMGLAPQATGSFKGGPERQTHSNRR